VKTAIMAIPDRPNHSEVDKAIGPVTVIVTRRAKVGKTQEFEEWMDGILHAAMKFEGHMGVNVIRPVAPGRDYTIIFRFDTYSNLTKWENSEIRKEWLKKSLEIAEGEPVVTKQTGLEFWFTPKEYGKDGQQLQRPTIPPRYKMAIVTGAFVFVLLISIAQALRQTLGSVLPSILVTLISVIVMVILMTYLIMPTATKIMRPWLYKTKLF
jgi:antibiotic biosynthesis monooxygenase (ABM) superfamily enzyme